jgi:hypothetical protein
VPVKGKEKSGWLISPVVIPSPPPYRSTPPPPGHEYDFGFWYLMQGVVTGGNEADGQLWPLKP